MKHSILIFLFLTTTLFTKGQFIKSVGIKGGLCVAHQDWVYKDINNDFFSDAHNGIYYSASLEFLKSKYLGIVADIGYCQKGATDQIPSTTIETPDIIDGYYTIKTDFNYFTLSPMLKVKYETKHFIPYILLGLRLDYQLSWQTDIDLDFISDHLQKTIWGMNSGVGFEYKIKQLGIFAEGQYQYDFTKVMDKSEDATSAAISIQNRAYIICLGLKYYFHKKEEKK